MAGSPLDGTLIQEDGGDHADIDMVTGMVTIVVIVMATGMGIVMVILPAGVQGMLLAIEPEHGNLRKAISIEIELME